ncbi:MAG: hypothetical protein ACXW18_02435, partial [Pyrinomonadaceae bacterium]
TSKPPGDKKPKKCQGFQPFTWDTSSLGGLSNDELDDVSAYDIDRELYGDEAVGAGRTYADDRSAANGNRRPGR